MRSLQGNARGAKCVIDRSERDVGIGRAVVPGVHQAAADEAHARLAEALAGARVVRDRNAWREPPGEQGHLGVEFRLENAVVGSDRPHNEIGVAPGNKENGGVGALVVVRGAPIEAFKAKRHVVSVQRARQPLDKVAGAVGGDVEIYPAQQGLIELAADVELNTK